MFKKIFLNVVFIILIMVMVSTLPKGWVHAIGLAITVTTDADELTNNGLCSLREAIINANNDAQTRIDCSTGGGDDGIFFDTSLGTATINLTSSLPAISDTDGLSIEGGSDITISGANAYRVLTVNSSVPLSLNNIEIENGGITNGAGVYNDGSLMVSNTTFTHNNSSDLGGGIYNNSGTSTISNSIFDDNNAPNGGGGIYIQNGIVNITNSIFINNDSNFGFGGGIYQSNGTLSVASSTFSGSHAGFGGAIWGNGTINIANSTFYDNTANYGGALLLGGTANVFNSTISNNMASNAGGGLMTGNTAVINITNSILANSVGVVTEDCYNSIAVGLGSITGTNNIIETDASGAASCGFTNGVDGNIIGSDPNLGTLTGFPAYFPLNSGSLAIDAGDDTICAAAPVNNESQNGVIRPQGSHCDIGAFEKMVMFNLFLPLILR